MSRGTIKYLSAGPVYFVDGREVSQAVYDEKFPSKLEEMFRTGQTPFLMTDSVFMEGHCNGNQFEGQEHTATGYADVAKRHKFNTKGKVYVSQLAKFPGDPEAWVSGRGDVAKVCEKYGYNSEGAVNCNHLEKKPVKRKAVADYLVKEQIERVMAVHPEPRSVNKEELKHQIIEKVKLPWLKSDE